MKAIFILSVLLALSFAAFNNPWATCDDAPADSLIQPLNSTFIKNAAGLTFTINFCAKAKDTLSIAGYSIYIFVDDSHFAVAGGTKYSGSLLVSTGQEFCYNIAWFGSFIFPANYTFQVQLKDDDKNSLNCLNTTLIVPSHSNQLSF